MMINVMNYSELENEVSLLNLIENSILMGISSTEITGGLFDFFKNKYEILKGIINSFLFYLSIY